MPDLRPASEPADPAREFRDRLEGELAIRHRALYPRPSTRAPWRRPVLAVVAAAAIALTTIAAIPARITVPLGQIVDVDLAPGTDAPSHGALLVHLLDARTGAARASASVSEDARGGHHVLLLAFGERLDPAGLRSGLEAAFPELAGGQWRMRAIEADVHTSLARALGRRVFAIEIDRTTLEARRRLVIERVAATGAGSNVTFDEADGIRVIEVRRP